MICLFFAPRSWGWALGGALETSRPLTLPLLIKRVGFFAVAHLEVAVVHFELEGAEALAVDLVGGISGGPVGPAALEGAVGLLGAEDLRRNCWL